MSNLPSSYALVTGGSSGMGLEYVKQLADKGYCVIIVALRQEEADPVAAAMAAAHPTQDFVAIGELTDAHVLLEINKHWLYWLCLALND